MKSLYVYLYFFIFICSTPDTQSITTVSSQEGVAASLGQMEISQDRIVGTATPSPEPLETTQGHREDQQGSAKVQEHQQGSDGGPTIQHHIITNKSVATDTLECAQAKPGVSAAYSEPHKADL